MATRTEKPAAMHAFANAFDKVSARGGAESLRALRRRAFTLFSEAGLPTTRQEEWRFTNVSPIGKLEFAVDGEDRSSLPSPGSAGDSLAGVNALCVGLIDGHWVDQREGIQGLPAGVHVLPLHRAAERISGDLLARLGGITDMESNAFAALNTSLFGDGVLIVVPDGVVLDRPLEIDMLSTAGTKGVPRAVFPRILVIAGRNSSLSLVEVYRGSGAGLTDTVVEIYVAEGAKVEHDRLQAESLEQYHINTMSVRQEHGSVFTSNAITFGGSLVRNGIQVTLAGPGAECTLNGLSIGTGAQHIDNHTTIDHAAELCTSHELYKTILDGSAHGVFNGKIFVRPGAQKTDAKQTNKTILLSDAALMNTKPQLEIFADDVKCTHGATVGQLDDEQLFYLRARGIGKDEARDMLTLAFANDVVSRVHVDAMREHLDQLLRLLLEGGRNKERR